MNQETLDSFVMETKLDLSNHETRLITLEETVKDIRDLTMSVHDLAQAQQRMSENLDTLSMAIEEIKEAPKKNWNTLKASIISALGGAIGTGLITAGAALIINNMR